MCLKLFVETLLQYGEHWRTLFSNAKKSFPTRSITCTEQTIRDTLRDFEADDIQGGQIWRSARYVGNFYATLDANRNLRNRDTLGFFVSKGSEKSRMDMIKRVSTFPCSHSVITWLHGIFTKLESHSQVLACILRRLGTNNVPQELFHLSRIASPTWGLDGETMGIAARGIPII